MNTLDATMTARAPGGAAALLGTAAGLRYGALGFALAFLSLPLYIVLPSHYATTHGVALATLGAVDTVLVDIDASVSGSIDDSGAVTFDEAAQRSAPMPDWVREHLETLAS